MATGDVILNQDGESKSNIKCASDASWRGGEIMSYEEAMRLASRDEAFKATIYAMNTLLIHKGIYTQDEFQQLFVEWVKKEESKKARARCQSPRGGFRLGSISCQRGC